MKKDPYDYAIKKLARRPYSIKKIRELLEQAGYEETAIQQTLARLVADNYLNDLAYARQLYELYTIHKPHGRYYLNSKMVWCGLPAEIRHAVLSEYDDEKEFETGSLLVARYVSRSTGSDPDSIKKYLQKKGFTEATISKIVGTISLT